MTGYIILLAFLLCGLLIANALFRKQCGLIRLWIGLCAGLVLMMWLPACFAFFLDFTRAANLAALGVAAVLAVLAQLLGRKVPRRTQRFTADIPIWFLMALILPLLALSGYLQYTHTLRYVDGALHVGQSTYGDLCLHLGIATSLQNASFPPEYSILPGTLLGYPFLSDSMVTTMLLFGGDLATSFVTTGTLMMGLVYLGFVIFAWRLTGGKKAAVALAYVLMFLNGGLGFLYTFDGVFKDSTMLQNVFTGYYQTPTNMPDLNLRWVNVICDMMVPQRTLLAGWTVLLPALYMLAEAVETLRTRDFVVLGVWAGLMPMIHTHSFFALGMLSIGVMGQRVLAAPRERKKKTFSRFMAYGLLAAIIAVPQLLTWTFPQIVDTTSQSAGSLTLRFNWVNNQGNGQLIDEYFWFWIKNVGLAYLVMVPAALTAKRRSFLRGLSFGALIIYAVAETIQFQPNPYDNNKLFYVAYMVMLPTVALYLTRLYTQLKGVRGRALLACVFIAVSTVSASLSLARETVSDYQLFGESEVEAAEFIKENLPADSTFLTGNQHCNAVAALTGRRIVCGTGSYLYYHGIDYSAQQAAETQMLADPENSAALFEEYNVDYVYISSYERSDFNADEAWFEANCALVYSNDGVNIYAYDEQ